VKWEDSGDDATWEDEDLVRKENPQLIKDFNESLRTGVKRPHGKEKHRKRKQRDEEDEDGKGEGHRSKKKKKNKKGKKDEKKKKTKDRNKEIIDNLSEGSSIVSGESTMEAALSLTFLANVLIGEEEKGDNSNSSMTHPDNNDDNINHNTHNTHHDDDDDEEMEQREDAGRNLSAFFGSLQPAQTRPTAAGFSSLDRSLIIDGSAWKK